MTILNKPNKAQTWRDEFIFVQPEDQNDLVILNKWTEDPDYLGTSWDLPSLSREEETARDYFARRKVLIKKKEEFMPKHWVPDMKFFFDNNFIVAAELVPASTEQRGNSKLVHTMCFNVFTQC